MSIDVRSLVESAIRAQIVAYGTGTTANTLISSDTAQLQHPGVRILTDDVAEEITPGSGIFRVPLAVDMVFKADLENAPQTSAFVQAVRQAFYRNDLDPRPMVSLAKQLTAAAAPGTLTVMGVVPRGDGPVRNEGLNREYVYRLLFDFHCTPRQ